MKKNLANVSKLFLTATAAAIVLTACDADDHPSLGPGNADRVVRALVAGYEGSGQALEGENKVENLHAFVFDEGRMVAAFRDVPPSEEGRYEIKANGYKGRMYVVANAGQLLDFASMAERNISEEEWLNLTLGLDGDSVAHFFTGSVELNAVGQTVVPVTLKRGVVRFDLRLQTDGEAALSSLVLRQLTDSVRLFPEGGMLAARPDGAERVVEVNFAEPLTTDRAAVAYVYEQADADIEVEARMTLDGRPLTLKGRLEGNLVRNSIYAITVGNTGLEIGLVLDFEDWADGGETVLKPVW
ncbi:MAG: fimbrial protein [Bacteroidaceae bacterium]|jgi:hypothetical protein